MSDSKALSSRVAIVTGGARGTGLAIAAALAAEGASLVIADNGTGFDGDGADPSVAPAAAKQIGPQAIAFTESIASPSAAAACVALARRSFGGLDIVINNAAIRREAFIFEGTAGDWEAVLRNDLSAAWYLLNAATPVMLAQVKAGRGGGDYRWGRVVNLAASAGLYGDHGQGAYAAAKAGLVSLTRVVAMEMARTHVTCNAVVPLTADAFEPAGKGQVVATGSGSDVVLQQVGKVVAWLCSDAAAGVSGQLIGVHGRRVLLFAPPQPVAQLTSDANASIDGLADAAALAFDGHYLPLETDLAALGREPLW